MGVDKFTWEEVLNMDLPPVILYAVPIMLSLVFLEYLLSTWKKRRVYEGKDILSSALIGIGNLISTGASKALTFFLVWCVYYYLAPVALPAKWWSYILCIVALDFARYWAHRIAHEQRFWWATHITHHSSENYNFGVSFRLSWVQQFKLIFFLPVALFGFDPFVFFVCHQIEVLYQFWIHTEFIKKLPRPIEYFFTTPSHHRVHHAVNGKYLDKNYGSTFIIWDRIFGTFQPEEEQAIYGITSPPRTYNPIRLVFDEFVDIFRDMGKVKGLGNKIKLLASAPGSKFDPESRKFVPPVKEVIPQAVIDYFEERGEDRKKELALALELRKQGETPEPEVQERTAEPV